MEKTVIVSKWVGKTVRQLRIEIENKNEELYVKLDIIVKEGTRTIVLGITCLYDYDLYNSDTYQPKLEKYESLQA